MAQVDWRSVRNADYRRLAEGLRRGEGGEIDAGRNAVYQTRRLQGWLAESEIQMTLASQFATGMRRGTVRVLVRAGGGAPVAMVMGGVGMVINVILDGTFM